MGKGVLTLLHWELAPIYMNLTGIQVDNLYTHLNNLTAGNYLLSIWEGTCMFDTVLTVGNNAAFSTSIGFTGK